MKVGDRVVCVKSHSQSSITGVVKGMVFQIHHITKCPSCGYAAFDVGVKSIIPITKCSCGRISDSPPVWYIGSRLFAPITYNSAMDELLNKEIVEEKADIEIKEPQKA